ncbi:MAG: radical SAM protein, partial [Candidatus Omnitrophica bacterium]|nr:radical SAM protein [Candidatus Omnitrophota bacterium]
PPLGILYLASYIQANSPQFRPLIIDAAAGKMSLSGILERIEADSPFVIGISSMTPQLQGAVELAGAVKKKFKDTVKIFFGGPHISADPAFIGRFEGLFDYAIKGEGEKTFLNSLHALVSGCVVPRIQEGEPAADLDSLPFPDRKLLVRKNYGAVESMIFSRGCPYDCYYCSRPSISKKVRYRSAKNMVEEILSVFPGGKGKVDFQDDTFTLDRKKVLEFCEEAAKRSVSLEWRCNSRIDLVDEELLTAMKRAGCMLIHFGIESGNERIRKEVIHKGAFSNERIYEVFGMCRKSGIRAAGYFMIGHPQETEKEIGETKEMIVNSGIDLMGLSIPTPFPGSNLFEIAHAQGVINEEIMDKFTRKELGEGYTGNYPVFISPSLSRDYLFSVMQEINRKFYLNGRIFFRKLAEDIISPRALCRDARDFFSLILKGVSSRKPYVKDR